MFLLMTTLRKPEGFLQLITISPPQSRYVRPFILPLKLPHPPITHTALLPDEPRPGGAAEVKDCCCHQPHSLTYSAPEVKGAGPGERLQNVSTEQTPQEYDVQKLKLSTELGNPSELNRDLVVLVESSSPHQPSLVVEVEDSEVGPSRQKSYSDSMKGGEEQCSSSLFGARLQAARAKS